MSSTMTCWKEERRIAAALLAPLVFSIADPIVRRGYLQMEGHWAKYPGILLADTVLGYVFFAVIGSLAWLARISLKAPVSMRLVVVLFAAVAMGLALSATAIAAILTNAPLWHAPVAGVALGLVAAAATLPLSLAYCLIAGIPWRDRAPRSPPQAEQTAD